MWIYPDLENQVTYSESLFNLIFTKSHYASFVTQILKYKVFKLVGEFTK